MIRLLLGLAALGVVTSTVFGALVLLGALHFVRNRRQAATRLRRNEFLPPVSLLKPLHGAEPDLEAHLESFFLQDYPFYEILFCARELSDAGLATARRVAARHPSISAKFLVAEEPVWTNAKVSSLERMARAATSDIFIISDSDVRVTPAYIREVVAPFADPKVGGVTCLYRGVADGSLWSGLEAVGMSAEMTAGVLVADRMEGMQFALGPTMAVRRACVDEIGGFGVLGPYCSDDFLLGNRIAAHGHTIVLSDHVIDHVILNTTFLPSLKHQVRWMKSTRFSRPKGHLGTALTFSVPFGILAFAAALPLHHPLLGLALLAWSIANRMLLAAVIGSAVVRDPRLARLILLYPLRDLMGFFFWAASYAGNRILWRGEVYSLGPEGLMFSTEKRDAHEPVATA